MLYFKCCSYCGNVQSVYGDSSSDLVVVDECDNCKSEKHNRGNKEFRFLRQLLDEMSSYNFEFKDGSLYELGNHHKLDFSFTDEGQGYVIRVWDKLEIFSEDLEEKLLQEYSMKALLKGILIDPSSFDGVLQKVCVMIASVVAKEFGTRFVYSKWESPLVFACLVPKSLANRRFK